MENKKVTTFSIRETVIVAVLAYLSAVCTVPSAGILGTLPVCAVFSVAASVFCKNRGQIYLMFAVMPFIVSPLLDFGIKRGLFYAFVCFVSAFFAILLKRAVLTASYSKKNGDKNRLKKSIAVAFVSLVVSIVWWVGCFGNPISALLWANKNQEYADRIYAGDVKTSYTYYSVKERGYLTNVAFEDGDKDKRYYISAGKKDEVQDFYIGLITTCAKDYFYGQTFIDTTDVLCYLDKDIYSYADKFTSSYYFKDYEYLLMRNETVTDMAGFIGIYESLFKLSEQSKDFVYKRIILTALDADKNAYYAVKTPDSDVEFSKNNRMLESDIAEKFGEKS